ncbi:MAG TPA: ABC transporter permease [Verrucomicrobiae bacterium]|nr:ABC transporter permease [Verrucomicrobiae bacterium]
MDTFWQDVRFGLRMLKKSPGVTALAIVALALGIGVNTSIFTLVNAILLRPLPYRDPGQLVQPKRVSTRAEEGGPSIFGNGATLTGTDFFDWRDETKSFSQIAAFSGDDVNLTGGETPERVRMGSVTDGFFGMLGVQPGLGRVFLPQEDLPNVERVVILTHSLWKRRYSSDLNIVGKAIQIDGKSAIVVGVLPAGFVFREPFELYSPFRLDPVVERVGEPRVTLMEILGRLKPGVSIEQARAEMDTISSRNSLVRNAGGAPPAGEMGSAAAGPGPVGGQMIVKKFHGPPPGEGEGVRAGPPPSRVELIGWHEQIVSNVRGTLMILLAAVGFVLLIACANVANLLLARATARQKEIAIRTALGAARLRIIRQLLIESVLLSCTGAFLGLLLAHWSLDVARIYASAHLPTMRPITIDGWVLAFTVLIALGTGILFGFAPAYQAAGNDVNDALKEGSRAGGASRTRHRFRSGLVVLQTALAIVLLAGAGLLFRSFMQLRSVDKGFQPESVLTASMILPEQLYPTAAQQSAFVDRVLERVRALPGVEIAAATDHIPLADYSNMMFTGLEGEMKPGPISFVAATPEFFSVLRIKLRDGRIFDRTDGPESASVAVVNEAFVKQFVPVGNPIGKRVRAPAREHFVTIVGVVSDVVANKVESKVPAELYRPMAQTPERRLHLAIRSSGDMAALESALRGVVRSIDANQPIYEIMTMEERVAQAIAPRRLNLLLLGGFASLALLLSAVGIYGVMSYVVSQRTHEIGVRMALGAERADILQLILNQGMRLVGAGVLVGLIAALALTKSLRALLYGVGPQDPITFLIAPAVLLVVALLACWFPARRATKADPMLALRCE